MAIVVDYTPVEVVAELATEAGQSIYQEARRKEEHQQEMMILNDNLHRRNMEFQNQQRMEAMAEQYRYNSMMLEQKKQIDMDLELADYARNKQKLAQTMNMIQESEDFSEREKSELSLQAMSKYSGLGQGITNQSFEDDSDPMKRFMQQGTFKQSIANQLQIAVDSGQIPPEEAENIARAYGLAVDFSTKDQQTAKQSDALVRRLNTAMKAIEGRFIQDDGKLYTSVNGKKGDKVKEDDPRYETFKVLKKQVDEAQRALEDLQQQSEVKGLRQTFQTELQASPQLQKAVEIYGADKAFEEWRKMQGRQEPVEDENEPMFKMTPKNLIPGYGAYQMVKGMVK